jgi:hypothetical protein
MRASHKIARQRSHKEFSPVKELLAVTSRRTRINRARRPRLLTKHGSHG